MAEEKKGGGSGEEEEEDFFDVTIQRSGCGQQHHALQDCYSEKGDWRKCGKEMAQFRECMDRQKRTKSNNTQHRT